MTPRPLDLRIEQLLRRIAPQVLVHYRAAADRTASIPERSYLITQAARLSDS